MLGYTNKQITTAEMIAQLLELAKWVREAKQHGRGTRPERRGDRVLRRAGGERVGQGGDEVRHAPPDGPRAGGDGQEDAQARLDAARERAGDLRRKVRRLLAMYGYPPDLSEDATQLVLKQAELSTGNRNRKMLRRFVAECLTLMRPPVVKRQTTPRSGCFLFFRCVGSGAVTLWQRVLTSFPSVDETQRVCTKHLSRLCRHGDGDYRGSCSGPLRPRNLSVPSYRPIQGGG